jgi:hypothetical protein
MRNGSTYTEIRTFPMARDDAYGVYFIFKSMEQGPSFRVSVPKYATKDPKRVSDILCKGEP